MLYNDKMIQTISANKIFVESLTDSEVEDLMKEFDYFAIEEQSTFFCKYNHVFNNESFNSYLSFIYTKHELFKIFDRERKSITVNKETKKDLVEGPFLLN